MTRGLLSVVAALMIAGGGAPAKAQQSRDLRGMETENDALAWRAVGRLDMQNNGFCTATLISPEFVLTAAHCVFFHETSEPVRPEDITFRAGFRRGDAAAERGVSQIEPHPRFNPGKDLTAGNIRYDVALLRLSQPIPTTEVDAFVVADRTPNRGRVSLVSYGQNREALPSRQDVCEIKDTYEGVMALDCEATFGSSGAPVLRDMHGTRQIVSVVSGGAMVDGEKLTFGMMLPDVVADLQHQMWANKAKPVATIKRIQVGSGAMAASSGGAKFIRP